MVSGFPSLPNKKSGIVPFVTTPLKRAFRRIFTVAFLPFLAHAGALILRGQLPIPVGQSPKITYQKLL